MSDTHKYDIEVKSGRTESESHMDSQRFYLSIFGTNSNLLELLVDKESSLTQKKQLFERNALDKFVMYTKGVGNIRKISIRHESSELWNLEYIRIRMNEQVFTFIANALIGGEQLDIMADSEIKSETVASRSKKPTTGKESVTNYEIQVKTSSIFTADEKQNVRISLLGTSSDANDIILNHSENNLNAFENEKQFDRFLFNDLVDIGNVIEFKNFIGFLRVAFRSEIKNS